MGLLVKDTLIKYKMNYPLRKLYQLCALLFLSSCASIQPPTGGPDDTTAAHLISVYPPRASTNFDTEEKITFLFDERIEATKLYQSLLISPYTEAKYKFEAAGKKLVFQFKESLDSNTTYTLNFGDGVTDITAKNPVLNFSYAFSTGNEIDSLMINGSVYDCLSEEAVEGVSVAIYLLHDSLDISKDYPTYYSKTDKQGMFEIKNIREDDYLLLAFKDDDLNKRYSHHKESFAIYPDTIYLKENLNDIKLRLRTAEPEATAISNQRDYQDFSLIAFNNGLEKYEVYTLDQEKLFSFFDKKENNLFIYHQFEDSTKVRLMVTDSLRKQIDTTISIQTADNEFKSEELKLELKEKTKINYKNDTLSLYIQSNLAIESYDLSKFHIIKDTLVIDTLNENEVQLNENKSILNISYPNKEDSLTINIDTNAIVSYSKDSSEALMKQYLPTDLKLFGTMVLTVATDYESYELQLLSSDKVIKSIKNPKEYTVGELKSGKYSIRVLIDEDNDGMYELGSFEDFSVPEPVYNHPKEIEINANWIINVPDIKF